VLAQYFESSFGNSDPKLLSRKIFLARFYNGARLFLRACMGVRVGVSLEKELLSLPPRDDDATMLNCNPDTL
jgi:hypothetical protein